MSTGHCPQAICVEALLRRCWSKRTYLSRKNEDGEAQHRRPFLVEDGSKAHIERIDQMMRSDEDWACIAMIAHIAMDAERLGQWAENCPCHTFHDGGPCALKGCRAPELAVGVAMVRQLATMRSNSKLFPAYLAKAPPDKQAKLNASWNTACSRLFGYLLSICCHNNYLFVTLCRVKKNKTYLN